MHLSSSSDEVNVTVNSQSQLSVDMPGPSNKRMESRFRKSVTQELDTEYFNTDSENASQSYSSDQGNVTVDSESECQSQIAVDMPGPSNKRMESRFRKSATQELDTEYFNTDSENANQSYSSDQGNHTVLEGVKIKKKAPKKRSMGNERG